MDRFANASMAEKMKDVPGMISAVKQICFDVFVHLPFMYFPAFYTVKEFCQGSSYNPVDWVKVLDSQPSGTFDSHRCALKTAPASPIPGCMLWRIQ